MSARRVAAVGLVFGLVAAGCSQTTEGPETIPDTTSTSTTATIQTTSTTSPPTSSTTPDPSDEVAETFERYWAVWTAVRQSDPLDMAPLGEVAAAAIVADAQASTELERVHPAGGPGWIVRMESEVNPLEVTVVGDTATWDGCVSWIETLDPIDPEQSPMAFDALYTDRHFVEFRREGTAWIVTSIETTSDHCVPLFVDEAMVAAIFAGYEAYWDRRGEYFDPPNPNGAALVETTTGRYRTFTEGLIAELAERGVALRGRVGTHPELSEFGLGTAVILDCQAVPLERGVFDIETGERQDDIEVVEGQRDIDQTFLVLEDGVWKVSSVAGAADVDCPFGGMTSEE